MITRDAVVDWQTRLDEIMRTKSEAQTKTGEQNASFIDNWNCGRGSVDNCLRPSIDHLGTKYPVWVDDSLHTQNMGRFGSSKCSIQPQTVKEIRLKFTAATIDNTAMVEGRRFDFLLRIV